MNLHLKLRVNNELRHVEVAPATTLLEALRGEMFLTGAKEGCGVGECGTCVVLVDGEPVTSCLMLAGDAVGCQIETVEGLAVNGELSRVQRAFIAAGALQCGFCTPAMVLSATALLRRHPHPAREDIKTALGGVLCRCGAYPKIIEAVLAAAGEET
jgi:aerobic-type carbon monoxide dehydrogenase small subunit (CoxS/CutS family)